MRVGRCRVRHRTWCLFSRPRSVDIIGAIIAIRKSCSACTAAGPSAVGRGGAGGGGAPWGGRGGGGACAPSPWPHRHQRPRAAARRRRRRRARRPALAERASWLRGGRVVGCGGRCAVRAVRAVLLQTHGVDVLVGDEKVRTWGVLIADPGCGLFRECVGLHAGRGGRDGGVRGWECGEMLPCGSEGRVSRGGVAGGCGMGGHGCCSPDICHALRTLPGAYAHAPLLAALRRSADWDMGGAVWCENSTGGQLSRCVFGGSCMATVLGPRIKDHAWH